MTKMWTSNGWKILVETFGQHFPLLWWGQLDSWVTRKCKNILLKIGQVSPVWRWNFDNWMAEQFSGTHWAAFSPCFDDEVRKIEWLKNIIGKHCAAISFVLMTIVQNWKVEAQEGAQIVSEKIAAFSPVLMTQSGKLNQIRCKYSWKNWAAFPLAWRRNFENRVAAKIFLENFLAAFSLALMRKLEGWSTRRSKNILGKNWAALPPGLITKFLKIEWLKNILGKNWAAFPLFWWLKMEGWTRSGANILVLMTKFWKSNGWKRFLEKFWAAFSPVVMTEIGSWIALKKLGKKGRHFA